MPLLLSLMPLFLTLPNPTAPTDSYSTSSRYYAKAQQLGLWWWAGLALSNQGCKKAVSRSPLHASHDTLLLPPLDAICLSLSTPHIPLRAQASSPHPSSSLFRSRRDHAPLWWGRGRDLLHPPPPRPPLPLFNQGLRACPPPSVHPCPALVIIPDTKPTTTAAGTCTMS